MQAFYSQSWQFLIKLVVIATDCDSELMTSGSSGPFLLLRLLVINCEVDLHDLLEDVWEVTGLDSVGFPKRKLTRENRLCQLWFQKINCSLNNLSSE